MNNVYVGMIRKCTRIESKKMHSTARAHTDTPSVTHLSTLSTALLRPHAWSLQGCFVMCLSPNVYQTVLHDEFPHHTAISRPTYINSGRYLIDSMYSKRSLLTIDGVDRNVPCLFVSPPCSEEVCITAYTHFYFDPHVTLECFAGLCACLFESTQPNYEQNEFLHSPNVLVIP